MFNGTEQVIQGSPESNILCRRVGKSDQPLAETSTTDMVERVVNSGLCSACKGVIADVAVRCEPPDEDYTIRRGNRNGEKRPVKITVRTIQRPGSVGGIESLVQHSGVQSCMVDA